MSLIKLALFYKEAINLAQLKKVNTLAKPNLIRRNISESSGHLTKGPGIQAYVPAAPSQRVPRNTQDKIYMRGDIGRSIADTFVSPTTPEGILKIYKDMGLPEATATRMLPDSLRKVQSNPAAMSQASAGKKIRTMDPQNKEVFNRSMLQHENIERKYSRQGTPNSPQYHGHAGPQVLMEESNLVRSLPPQYTQAQSAFKDMRNHEQNLIQKIMPSFQYGQTRLSRHARRHINDILQSKWQPEMRATNIIG
jgi:hypothetical protein